MTVSQELSRQIAAIAPIPCSETTDPVIVNQGSSEIEVEGVTCGVDETTRRQTLAFDDMVAFDPNADTLWPGSIVQGKSLRDGLLVPIGLERAPLSITVTTPLGLPATSRAVEHPSLASVTEAKRELLAPVTGATPARMSFLCRSASSLEQGLLAVGCDVKWIGGSVRADVSARMSTSQSIVIARLMQVYYTVACTPPASPAALFGDTVTPADLQPYVGDGNPPAYISSVTFGRLLLFVLQSSESATELEASVNAAFNGAVSGTVDVKGKYEKVLQSSQMQVLAIGGSAQHAAEVIAGGRLEAIGNYVRAGATFSHSSPGLPISFQARYLRDNTPSGMALTTSWTQRTIRGRDVQGRWDVGPRSGLVDTGIVVRPGDHLAISSSGTVWSGVALTGWADGKGWVTWAKPGGSGFPMMNTHPFSLIGRTGGGEWFYIGSGKEHVHIGATGTLKLSINTDNHGIGDGKLKVDIKVKRREEP